MCKKNAFNNGEIISTENHVTLIMQLGCNLVMSIICNVVPTVRYLLVDHDWKLDPVTKLILVHQSMCYSDHSGPQNRIPLINAWFDILVNIEMMICSTVLKWDLINKIDIRLMFQFNIQLQNEMMLCSTSLNAI